MPSLPTSDPLSPGPASRGQVLLSWLCLFLAVVFAPAGRRELVATAAQLVQWLTGDASPSEGSPSSPAPVAANRDQRLIAALQAAEQALTARKAELEPRSTPDSSTPAHPARTTPAAAATPQPAVTSPTVSHPAPTAKAPAASAATTALPGPTPAPAATGAPCSQQSPSRQPGHLPASPPSKTYRLRSLPGE